MGDASPDFGAVPMRKLCDGDKHIVYIANYPSVEVALHYSLLVHVVIARNSLVSRQRMWNIS